MGTRKIISSLFGGFVGKGKGESSGGRVDPTMPIDSPIPSTWVEGKDYGRAKYIVPGSTVIARRSDGSLRFARVEKAVSPGIYELTVQVNSDGSAAYNKQESEEFIYVKLAGAKLPKPVVAPLSSTPEQQKQQQDAASNPFAAVFGTRRIGGGPDNKVAAPKAITFPRAQGGGGDGSLINAQIPSVWIEGKDYGMCPSLAPCARHRTPALNTIFAMQRCPLFPGSNLMQ